MSVQKNLEETKKKLQKHNQSHLLAFWDQLDETEQQDLLAQIQQLDFVKIDQWIENIIKNPDSTRKITDFTAPPYYPSHPANPEQQRKYSQAIELGNKLIAAGKVAAFVVAGGQGTRLGIDGPKGDYPIGPVSERTLFHIFADTISAVSRKYKVVCPWYIMTSPPNHDQTVEIFKSKNYYGLGAENVFIFQQGTLPNFDSEGQILMEDKARIARSPDGHGGSLKALHQSGALEDMKRRGVEYLSYWQVDNPLVKIFDPLFIGLHALDGAEMSSKALEKKSAEKIGIFSLIDGRIKVIEYSELDESQNANSSSMFQLGSIAIHLINHSFVERLNAGDFALPLHKAVKSIPHIDPRGHSVESDGIKLESFVFDALPRTSKSIILMTPREEEFAPTKNRNGEDSVDTTKQMIVARAAGCLESAGVTIPKKPDGSIDCLLEIAPGFALDKEDLKKNLDRIPTITPGAKIFLS